MGGWVAEWVGKCIWDVLDVTFEVAEFQNGGGRVHFQIHTARIARPGSAAVVALEPPATAVHGISHDEYGGPPLPGFRV